MSELLHDPAGAARADGVIHCAGCGRPAGEGDHGACVRRQAATDPPRYCTRCGRKLVVQVLPTRWRARCVRCGELPGG
ncbi:MAG: hypothetical protein ABSH51_20690 [Solirubrobacteraceae bacterium]